MNTVAASQKNVLFIYDLPPHQVTSVALAQMIKKQTNYDLEHAPQIRRDPNRPFWTAVIRIDDSAVFEQVATKLRHFDFEGHPIRALPYTVELTGANISKIQDHNTFVRKIPKDYGSKGLEEYYKKFGEIMACKVSIDENYKSRGYGFVCFKDPEAAQKALESTQANDSFCTVKFNPKLKGESRKAFNTIFIKDVPPSFDTVEGVTSLFTPFG